MRARRRQTTQERSRGRAVRLRRSAGARGECASCGRLRDEAGVEPLVRREQPDEYEANREQGPGGSGRDRLDALLRRLRERPRTDEHVRAEELGEDVEVLRGGIE